MGTTEKTERLKAIRVATRNVNLRYITENDPDIETILKDDYLTVIPDGEIEAIDFN